LKRLVERGQVAAGLTRADKSGEWLALAELV
jgi:hypothetical protein